MAKKSVDMSEQILKAATRLFAVNGFAATSIQAVADRVGIRKQSLLYHFSSKEKLRIAVIEAIFSHWKEVVPAALVQATTGVGRLESALRVFIDFFVEDKARAQLVIREIMDRPRDMEIMLKDHLSPWIGLVTQYIRKGQRRGEVYAEVDPESYVIQSAILAICIIAASGVLSAVYPEEQKQERVLERLVCEIIRLTKAGLFK